ncbi:MAG: hypothetical protein ABL989_08755 [Gammaproteobacteria bacterium]
MTSFWRTLVLILAGLGAAWAVTRVGGVPPTVFNSLDDTAPAAAGLPPAPAEAAAPSQADIEAQIRQAEEALGDRADPNEELPVDPLRVDVAISLPSDI